MSGISDKVRDGEKPQEEAEESAEDEVAEGAESGRPSFCLGCLVLFQMENLHHGQFLFDAMLLWDESLMRKISLTMAHTTCFGIETF